MKKSFNKWIIDVSKYTILGVIILFLIFVINNASAHAFCYQETANITSSCGGYNNGTYDISSGWSNDKNIYDGNLSSFATTAVTPYMRINYSKPWSATNYSLWQVKDMLGGVNITIPYDCFNNFNDKVQLIIETNPSFIDYSCTNATNKKLIWQSPGVMSFYEEAIIWNVSNSIIIKFKDNLNGSYVLPSCTFTYGSISIDGTYTMNNYVNDTMSCTLTGYNSQVTSFNITSGDFNVTMTRNGLLINYMYYNGTMANTSGYYTDGLSTSNFSSSYLYIYTQNITQDKINVYFGTIGDMNFTQFYEFDKDWITNTIENISIINSTSYKVYVKVTDESGNPIKDALVKMTFSNPYYGGSYKLGGQRFTEDEGIQGITYFYVPKDSDISLLIYKDTYDSQTILRNIQSNEYTVDNPIRVTLKRSIRDVYKSIKVTVCEYFNNNTANIPISISAPSRQTVYFTTSDNPSHNYSISLSLFKNGAYNCNYGSPLPTCTGMTNGNEFNTITEHDLNITFYVDGQYFNTYTIKWRGIDSSKSNEPTNINSGVYYKIVWISFIMIIGVLGLIFKKDIDGEGTGGAGKVLFLIGCLIIPLIFNGTYMLLFVITCTWGLLTIIKKVISE